MFLFVIENLFYRATSGRISSFAVHLEIFLLFIRTMRLIFGKFRKKILFFTNNKKNSFFHFCEFNQCIRCACLSDLFTTLSTKVFDQKLSIQLFISNDIRTIECMSWSLFELFWRSHDQTIGNYF